MTKTLTERAEEIARAPHAYANNDVAALINELLDEVNVFRLRLTDVELQQHRDQINLLKIKRAVLRGEIQTIADQVAQKGHPIPDKDLDWWYRAKGAMTHKYREINDLAVEMAHHRSEIQINEHQRAMRIEKLKRDNDLLQENNRMERLRVEEIKAEAYRGTSARKAKWLSEHMKRILTPAAYLSMWEGFE